jgi:hypothetical protein
VRSGLVNAMQRRLRRVLAFLLWGVDEMTAVLASPACCGQSRQGIRSRTAKRCSQDSWQKAATYTRGALVDIPSLFGTGGRRGPRSIVV